MDDVLAGIRVVEVASWTFVPISGAVLSEWGADVIKVEHPASGDPQRGLVSSGLVPGAAGVNFMFEIPNRGKRSVGLDLSTDDGRELLYRLVESADVFVTNCLPGVRSRLGIDVEDIRARNPSIIYVRGTGQGTRGPDAEKGGFDGASFWARAGLAMAFKDSASEWPVDQRPAFGDVMGGLTIAGGIAAALLRRQRMGVPSVVDVSLLNLGMWNLAPEITSAKLYEHTEIPTFDRDSLPNPLVGTYPTKDGRFLILVLLQADRYWPDLCQHLGRPDLLEDPRFKDAPARYEHRRECIQVLRDVFRTRTYDEWRERLQTLEGVWAPLQTPLEVHDDPQAGANGYLEPITAGSGQEFVLPANPVQFDETPPSVRAAPGHGEHTDEVLLELGLTYDEILEHKVSGAVL
ncbi:MAG TPA: CoA transferase [Acidimicrobiia bacterium]|jgi:crotonobetainyl-CoA:carnitine CoA-transferase CaiB-like acyl-CoA transferase|nr:CoA transferase [Acidimicrobiia bacterium]